MVRRRSRGSSLGIFTGGGQSALYIYLRAILRPGKCPRHPVYPLERPNPSATAAPVRLST
eukprot:1196229-Prorocentrum_minimum.AAC.2